MKEDVNVLIVDDEITNVEYMLNFLENNYNIKVAYNGKQALKILSKIDIDLILLDIQMPVMNGYEVIAKIKKDTNLKDIPVIFITSSNNDQTLIKVFELGACDYITKPFNKEELKVRVKNHLNNYSLQKEVQHKIKQINSILNQQNNMVILSNENNIEFANKTFLDFLGIDCLEDFNREYNSISDLFVENDKFFHQGKIKDNQTWIDAILDLPSSQQIVKILSNKFILHGFSVNINIYEKHQYIITFNDISDSIIEQMKLEDKIIRDTLTDAYNREYFDQKYKNLLKEYNTENSTLAIGLLDLDNFKKVNDTYGHDIGDEVLIHFVNTIHKHSRDSDILIRWGGEEFVLILKVKTQSGLQKVLEHLREVTQNENFPKIGQITCSIGGSLYKNNEEIERTIKRADEAVYKAKSAGRNQVIII